MSYCWLFWHSFHYHAVHCFKYVASRFCLFFFSWKLEKFFWFLPSKMWSSLTLSLGIPIMNIVTLLSLFLLLKSKILSGPMIKIIFVYGLRWVKVQSGYESTKVFGCHMLKKIFFLSLKCIDPFVGNNWPYMCSLFLDSLFSSIVLCVSFYTNTSRSWLL